MTKYKGHVPVEEYGFIEYELEGTAQEAVEAYKEVKKEFNGGDGLNVKEYSDMRKLYLEQGTPPTQEQWEQMSNRQKRWYRDTENTIKSINE